MPIPIGLDGRQHRQHFLRRLVDFRRQPGNAFLGLIPLDLAFQRNLLGNCLDRLGIGFVFQRRVNDRLQSLDRGLRQAFLHCFIHFFPVRVPGAGGYGKAGGRCNHDENKSQRPTRSEQFRRPHDLVLHENTLTGVG